MQSSNRTSGLELGDRRSKVWVLDDKRNVRPGPTSAPRDRVSRCSPAYANPRCHCGNALPLGRRATGPERFC